MSENDFRRKVLSALTGCDVMRIEMAIEHGVPDLNVCYQGQECWVELKLITNGRILLRPAQFAWSMRRAVTHQGKIWVISANVFKVMIHRFPLAVIPHNKYLQITTGPHKVLPLNELGDRLKTILFTS